MGRGGVGVHVMDSEGFFQNGYFRGDMGGENWVVVQVCEYNIIHVKGRSYIVKTLTGYI